MADDINREDTKSEPPESFANVRERVRSEVPSLVARVEHGRRRFRAGRDAPAIASAALSSPELSPPPPSARR